MTQTILDKELNGSRNLFITGPAGTGKSYILNKYIEAHKNVLVCAPTGIAALHVGGETLHKAFHVPIPAFESPSFAKGKKGAITSAQLKVLAQADTLIIDEISMCRNDVFRFVIKVLRKAEKVKSKKIRIIVSGDFSQLPPVVKKTEIKLFEKFGLDPSGYAFTTQEWKSCNFKTLELSEPKRQEDVGFVEVLNKIRIGDFEDFELFNKRVNKKPDYNSAICICGTSAEADRINQEYIDSLPGPSVVYQSRKEGRANFAGSFNFNNDSIVVKKGAVIIFTSNDVAEGKYRNGSFGVIEELGENFATVKIDGKSIDVYRHEYVMYDYSVSGINLVKKEVGKIKQFPFKIGKAITIHKSQGQTFEKAIINPEIFAAGQLYVVLSRVKSLEGISLTREIDPEALIVDEKVRKFYENGYVWMVKAPKKTASKPKTTKKTTAKKPKTTAKTVTKRKTTTAKTTKKKTAVRSTAKKKPAPKRTSTAKKTKTTAKSKKPAVKKTTVRKPKASSGSAVRKTAQKSKTRK